MNETLVDFYRCPETFVKLALAGELSPETGYFCFDRDAICYGQSAVGSLTKDVSNGLRDLSRLVTSDGPTLRVPFDPSQVVNNLRTERYATNGYAGNQGFLSKAAVRKAYYTFRPWLPVSVRKHFQRLFLRGWDRLTFPKWPVDRSVELIMQRLLLLSIKAQKIETVPFIWFWPEDAPNCVMITHDVETWAGIHLVERLMDVDDAFGIKASFQVIPEKRYQVTNNLVKSIRDRGFEFDVQDLTHEGNLFEDREDFLSRSRAINQHVKEHGAQGFRAGSMYRKTDWYEALDISYDMSIPNVAHLEAQRGGCCTVFPYFIGNILELPLTTSQDYSLLHVLGDYSIELWKEQIALVSEVHGLVSFIIHPDYIMERRALNVYKGLLGYLSDLRRKRKSWFALPQEVNRWWRERSQMRLVPEDGKWHIEGKGKERARVAYATRVGENLRYTFDAAA